MSANNDMLSSEMCNEGYYLPIDRINECLITGSEALLSTTTTTTTTSKIEIDGSASIYLRSVLEYIITRILNSAGNIARNDLEKKILPRHIILSIRNNSQLNMLLGNLLQLTEAYEEYEEELVDDDDEDTT